VNDVLIATVSRILLARYGVPESPNHHIRCLCHVVNLVVQDILAALGEADDPDEYDYFLLNKDQPFHLDIDTDPDQLALDGEEFQEQVEDESEPENVVMEDEEKLEATRSSLSKVRDSLLGCRSIFLTEIYISFVSLQREPCRLRNSDKNFVDARLRGIHS